MLSFSFVTIVTLYLSCLLPNVLLALPTARYDHTLATLPAHDRSNHAQEKGDTKPYTHRLHRRGLAGAVYICTADNFRGACAWTAPNDRCHIAGTGNNSARSIGPDEDGFCVLFETATCTGKQIETLRFPGKATNMPTFMSLKCFADRPPDPNPNANATLGGNNGTRTGARVSQSIALMSDADPRLAGGVGSMERKKLGKIMEQMEKDGFKQGMIGLKKGHYY